MTSSPTADCSPACSSAAEISSLKEMQACLGAADLETHMYTLLGQEVHDQSAMSSAVVCLHAFVEGHTIGQQSISMYNTWLLIELTPKGVFFSFLFSISMMVV